MRYNIGVSGVIVGGLSHFISKNEAEKPNLSFDRRKLLFSREKRHCASLLSVLRFGGTPPSKWDSRSDRPFPETGRQAEPASQKGKNAENRRRISAPLSGLFSSVLYFESTGGQKKYRSVPSGE